MNIYYENLRSFFERIKALNFWQRIFFWSSLKALSYEAYEEFKGIFDNISALEQQVKDRDARISGNEKDIEILSAKVSDLSASNQKQENRITNLESEIKRAVAEKAEMVNKITRFEQTDQSRLEEFQKNVSGVNAIRAGLENERQKLGDERIREKEEQFEKLKQTWRDHETLVKDKIKGICLSKAIDYIEKVPFKGSPDNTILLAGEFIIFDAKSPAGDDLANFPRYIRIQTESVKKYIKQENVKSDIFLVIPSNTLDVINQFSYNMGEYNVYVVSIDSLEPVITFLKKIEDFEFIKQLSPEERDNICRIIGRFTHTAKRKIQIDHFFSFQFLDILSKCKIDLPEDIYKIVEDFEKAEKLNPPQEKRAKQILLDDLLAETDRLAIEAKARMIESDNEKNLKSD